MKVFILLLLYWGSDGRSSMTSAEYTSRERCEIAMAEAKKVFDGWGARAYAVCTEK